MAERKSSSSSTLHSKGGTGEFTKQVQRKFSRAQEKVRFILMHLSVELLLTWTLTKLELLEFNYRQHLITDSVCMAMHL